MPDVSSCNICLQIDFADRSYLLRTNGRKELIKKVGAIAPTESSIQRV